MNGLEAAIKNALARSDRSSAEVRARIYQSSREALEAGLRKQNIEDPEVVAGHRQRLEQLIRIIEHDERERLLSLVAEHVKKTTPPQPVEKGPMVDGKLRREPAFDDGDDDPFEEESAVEAEPVVPVQSPAVSAPDVASPRKAEPLSARREEPVIAPKPAAAAPKAAAKPAATQRTEPRLGADDDFSAQPNDLGGAYDLTNSGRGDDTLGFKADPIVVHKKRRGFFARLLIIFTLLAFVLFGAVWVYTSGVLISAQERDQSVPNPPVEIQEEDFNGQQDGAAQAPPVMPDQQLSGGFSADWLEVFNAETNPAALRPGSMVSTENIELPSGKAVRVSSRSASSAGDLNFDVPAELMRVLTGRNATIAVTLQSSTDTPTHVAVDCDFNNLGHCSRHRFTAMPERSDFLIDAKFTDAIVANASGKISVNADIGGEGRAINLYSVRILPSN